MKFVSLFSGIGGFDLAFERAGMECVAQVEIDKHCLDILARYWPSVKRFEDVRNVGRKELGAVDLICGGFPCQDLSVAGRRKGLAGERSGLWFEFHRIIADVRPRWVVIENVPGLLSSNEGRDFAVILRGLAECGYSIAWRILDAQYFGLAQRRRRVFIVGSLGSGHAAQILFESEGMCGDSSPSRETWTRVAQSIAASSDRPGCKRDEESQLITNAFNGYTGGPDDNDAQANHIVAFSKQDDGRDATIDLSPTMRSESSCRVPGNVAIAFQQNERDELRDLGDVAGAIASEPGIHQQNFVIPPLRANGGVTSSPTLNKNMTDLDFLVFSAGQSSKAYGIAADENVTPPLRAGNSGTNQTPTVAYTIQHNDGGNHKRKDRPNGGMYVNETDTALTVGSTDLTAIAIQHASIGRNDNAGPAAKGWRDDGATWTLDGRGEADAVAVVSRDGVPKTANGKVTDLRSGNPHISAINMTTGVRRLTPTECERLQGFPDDWTNGQSDSVRYRQLGNAVAVPVVEWIGHRIASVSAVASTKAADEK